MAKLTKVTADEITEIPLPDEEAWAAPGVPDTVESAPADGAETPTGPEVEELDFVDPAKRLTTVPLDHPFRRAGKVIEEIPVNRLTAAEVGAVADAAGDDFSLYDLFAEMTGFPAAVLRGLDEDDSAAVRETCYDFLPRRFKDSE